MEGYLNQGILETVTISNQLMKYSDHSLKMSDEFITSSAQSATIRYQLVND